MPAPPSAQTAFPGLRTFRRVVSRPRRALTSITRITCTISATGGRNTVNPAGGEIRVCRHRLLLQPKYWNKSSNAVDQGANYTCETQFPFIFRTSVSGIGTRMIFTGKCSRSAASARCGLPFRGSVASGKPAANHSGILPTCEIPTPFGIRGG
jgi:hypothetical protein